MLGNVFMAVDRVFDHVVKERGANGFGVHLIIRENAGHRDGMNNIVFPGFSLLAGMGGIGQFKGVSDHLRIRFTAVFFNGLDDIFYFAFDRFRCHKRLLS